MVSATNYQVKPNGQRFVLEITLSECVDDEWERAYSKSLTLKEYTCMDLMGGPTIDKIQFYGNIALTKSFPKMAFSSLDDFKKDFEERLALADAVYKTFLIERKQREESEQQKAREKMQQLDEINKRLNNK